MPWSQLRGHDELIDSFRRAVVRGRLAHGYLLIGPPGVGKRTFALHFAQCLFCETTDDAELAACGTCPQCKQVLAGTHPDLLTIGCPPGKRELPIDLLLGPKERRGREGLCHDLSLRPMSAGRRIAIIDDADTMNESSANALLKTLEEPPPGAVIFVITPSDDAILPTIRSRCQPILFNGLGVDDIAALLVEQGHTSDPSVAQDAALLAEGSLENAADLLDPGLRQLRQTLVDGLSAQPFNSLQTAKRMLAAIDELGGDTATQREQARRLIRFATEHYRVELKRPAHTLADARADLLGDLIDRCIEADIHLQQTMPVPMCLEGLFDDLGRRMRQ